MTHTAFKCTHCGRIIHLPKRAQPGYAVKCFSCGARFTLARPGEGSVQGFQAPSLPRARKDQRRVCADPGCSRMFYLTVGEQEFYAQRGLVYPTRCPMHREERKRQRAATRQARPAARPKTLLERLLGL